MQQKTKEKLIENNITKVRKVKPMKGNACLVQHHLPSDQLFIFYLLSCMLISLERLLLEKSKMCHVPMVPHGLTFPLVFSNTLQRFHNLVFLLFLFSEGLLFGVFKVKDYKEDVIENMKGLENIPWEGEFTQRSDPCAGLIASCGSFFPMIKSFFFFINLFFKPILLNQ